MVEQALEVVEEVVVAVVAVEAFSNKGTIHILIITMLATDLFKVNALNVVTLDIG